VAADVVVILGVAVFRVPDLVVHLERGETLYVVERRKVLEGLLALGHG